MHEPAQSDHVAFVGRNQNYVQGVRRTLRSKLGRKSLYRSPVPLRATPAGPKIVEEKADSGDGPELHADPAPPTSAEAVKNRLEQFYVLVLRSTKFMDLEPVLATNDIPGSGRAAASRRA